MSLATLAELKQGICSLNGCWRTGNIEEANVVAVVGSHWRVLLLDFHFNGCVPARDRVGGVCDGVAVYPQNSNRRLRFLELKQLITDAPSALPQLQTGATMVEDRLPSGFQGLDVTAEVHVGSAPLSSSKFRKTIKVGSRKILVYGFCNGAQI